LKPISTSVLTVSPRFPLSNYINQALALAVYQKLHGRTFSGKIPVCEGVVASGADLHDCREGLRAALEAWIVVQFKLGRALPVIAGIDLNNISPAHKPKAFATIKGKNILSGRELQHLMVDARVKQSEIVRYIHAHGRKTLHSSSVSRVLNGQIRMTEDLESAILNAIEKLQKL
jgi:predicted RNase H-like HicB family nuclease